MSGTVEPVPARLHTVTTRMVFAHQGAEAIAFYGTAFGAEPIGESFVDPDGKVIHAEIRIGDSVVFITDEGDEIGKILRLNLRNVGVRSLDRHGLRHAWAMGQWLWPEFIIRQHRLWPAQIRCPPKP